MVKQLSVFVENQPGSLRAVTSVLKDAQVNIRAIACFDTPEFAILRLVVDGEDTAKSVLTQKGFVVRVTEVVAVELEDRRGNLDAMLETLENAEVNLNYIYSFVIRQGLAPVMVFHADDNEKAQEILEAGGIKIIHESDI